MQIIINSVAQYFPSVDYFISVVETCIEHVSGGGSISLGDLRIVAAFRSFRALRLNVFKRKTAVLQTHCAERVDRRDCFGRRALI